MLLIKLQSKSNYIYDLYKHNYKEALEKNLLIENYWNRNCN